MNLIIIEGFAFAQNSEHHLAVPMEFIDGSEYHVSGFVNMNLSALANKLANAPQTINVIICDHEMVHQAPDL